jgi:hypothetical protein
MNYQFFLNFRVICTGWLCLFRAAKNYEESAKFDIKIIVVLSQRNKQFSALVKYLLNLSGRGACVACLVYIGQKVCEKRKGSHILALRGKAVLFRFESKQRRRKQGEVETRQAQAETAAKAKAPGHLNSMLIRPSSFSK